MSRFTGKSPKKMPIGAVSLSPVEVKGDNGKMVKQAATYARALNNAVPIRAFELVFIPDSCVSKKGFCGGMQKVTFPHFEYFSCYDFSGDSSND